MFGPPEIKAREVESFTDADAAVARIRAIYERGAARIRARFDAFLAGARAGDRTDDACYPWVGMDIGPGDLLQDDRPSFGTLAYPGRYGATLTRPDLFADYYKEQIELLLKHHQVPIQVGVSARPIPLPFVIDRATADITVDDLVALEHVFTLPSLADIDDSIANGGHLRRAARMLPLSLFSAERVDLALQRILHYTGTEPAHFQRFILFTNYQRYVDEFIEYGHRRVAAGSPYLRFVGPERAGVSVNDADATGDVAPSSHLPQMPAYHLVRADKLGVTLVNIGVGPSNAKTITDHIAVLRPHCWLMIGHCGGLRRSQRLGDYVLAHAYLRDDHVLDRDLPIDIPVPPIAEIQVALQEAVQRVTGLRGRDLKGRMRTGTVATTDNRNWELRFADQYERLSQSRAIAIDMESATIAANGFRMRVPYGTLLCVSDRPLHGEVKLRGMANSFYRERIGQHLRIGLEAVNILREGGVDQLHSRKLRSFDEPAFR